MLIFMSINQKIISNCKITPITHKLQRSDAWIETQIERINPQIITDEKNACENVLFHFIFNINRVIALIGMLYINGSHDIAFVDGIINKTTKIILAIKNTKPAVNIEIIVREFFLNLNGTTFFSFSSINVFKETSKILESFTKTSKSGKLSPLSHFEIDLSLYWICSASSSWVIFAFCLSVIKLRATISFNSFIIILYYMKNGIMSINIA